MNKCIDMNSQQIKDNLKSYTERMYTDKLISVLLSEDADRNFSIAVDAMNLFASNIEFAHYFFQCPKQGLLLLNQIFQETAATLCKNHSLKTNMIYKEHIHARLIALPNLPELYKTTLPNCDDVGQFMCINGTVIRTAAPKMIEYRKSWRCTKCKHQFVIDACVEKGYICEKPLACPNPEWCNGKNFVCMNTGISTKFCKDYQEIKVQEQVQNLAIGSVPRSIWVILEEDLVETCSPGNDVNVSGLLIQRWKPLMQGNCLDIDLVLLAHNVEVKNKMSSGVICKGTAEEFGQFWLENAKDPLKGRNFILASICPQVFGLYIVKLAVALVQAGGVVKTDENSRIRGDSHLLLVGDPGTAKSQFLKFASKVSVRSVLTSGIGTTNAGLTVSAVKESGRWQLEAGALVLADGGMCCIDEFNNIKVQDKTCIHEAMEQQTISVAKAGLVCSLSTRCSILAATNPKGKYDENLSLPENTALGSPLLSRFDIILVLLDTFDRNWDEMVSSYILNGKNTLAGTNTDSLWSITKMKNYFSLIRYINPRITPECEKVLQTYYKRQRALEGRSAARTTPRLLQSLIRLAEGHARLMFRDEVLVIDAVYAIILMESSMLSFSILEGMSPLHTTFPNNPEAEFEDKARTILRILQLDELLSISKNYKQFYQDFNVKRLLLKISSVFHSTKLSYLFDRNNEEDFTKSMGIYNESCSTNLDNGHIDRSGNADFNFKSIKSLKGDGSHCTVGQETKNFNENLHNSSLLDKIKENKALFTLENGKECKNLHKNAGVVQNSEQLRNEISTLSDLNNFYDGDLGASNLEVGHFQDDHVHVNAKNISLKVKKFRETNEKNLMFNLNSSNQINACDKLANSSLEADSMMPNQLDENLPCDTLTSTKKETINIFKKFAFKKNSKTLLGPNTSECLKDKPAHENIYSVHANSYYESLQSSKSVVDGKDKITNKQDLRLNNSVGRKRKSADLDPCNEISNSSSGIGMSSDSLVHISCVGIPKMATNNSEQKENFQRTPFPLNEIKSGAKNQALNTIEPINNKSNLSNSEMANLHKDNKQTLITPSVITSHSPKPSISARKSSQSVFRKIFCSSLTQDNFDFDLDNI